MYVLGLVQLALTVLVIAYLFESGSESAVAAFFAFCLGLVGVCGFVWFLNGFFTQLDDAEQSLKDACVAIGGESFEGMRRSTGVSPTQCVRFVDGEPVNVTDEARDYRLNH